MKKVLEWLNTNSRWKHLAGGLCIGLGANDWYCAGYAGVVTAGALEYVEAKNYECDWWRLAVTAAGAIVGHAIRAVI